MKIIDVSGFGHSGKTAVSDLLREFEGVQAHDHSFEFGLMRLPDGILDLEHHLCGSWSPLRSDRAIKRFRNLCQILSSGYHKNLSERFLEKSLDYLDSLIEGKLFVDGWFDPIYEPPPANPVRQILKRMRSWGIAKDLAGIFSSRSKTESRKCEVFLSSPEDFLVKTKKYLEEILGGGMSGVNRVVVTSNMMEPFSPERSLKFFDDAFCVAVERDPRDIYASVVDYEKSFVPSFEANNPKYSMEFLKNLKKEMLGVDDLASFILRQSIYHRETFRNENSDRIIRIQYEELVLNYDETIDRLFTQLGLERNAHMHKKRFFDPEKSKQNIGIWKKMIDSRSIQRIENELSELLYLR